MEVISKEEFLKACNLKIQQDADEERRKQEEERRRREEEERRRREEEERRREADRIAREQREWDAWYNSLPSNCKRGFEWNGFMYRVNPQTRTITKQALGRDDRGRELVFRDSVRFSSLSVNEELGI